jgi:hypothetical protein
MKAIQLAYHADTNYSLVVLLRDGDTLNQFVICDNFNSKAQEWQWWANGHYFETLESAMEYWNTGVKQQPYRLFDRKWY